MKIINTINKICLCCMEKHDVYTVEVDENTVFKGKNVEYSAVYEFCDLADEYYANEEMITANDIAMKNAYRKQNNLLTTDRIINIRNKYSMSQRDLACLLGWGEKTITRYEGHQVQDIAHDSVLRKIDDDPEWFLELLEIGKNRIDISVYEKYRSRISKEYELMQDKYLRKSIQALYIKYQYMPEYNGNTQIDFDKIVEVICYYANSLDVTNLYKVKLMKLLWYADFLSYKRYNHSITGLVYKAMPMGALPIAHKLIIDLKGINYDEVEFEDGSGYKFIQSELNEFTYLTSEDINVLDTIIEKFGKTVKERIVKDMHNEVAYIETNMGELIDYKYAEYLSLQ